MRNHQPISGKKGFIFGNHGEHFIQGAKEKADLASILPWLSGVSILQNHQLQIAFFIFRNAIKDNKRGDLHENLYIWKC